MTALAIVSDGEFSAGDARALTDRIKLAVDGIWELIKIAYEGRAWTVLGYDSWDDYCSGEFGTARIRLPREERAEVVASLRESGLSTRAIAAATGESQATIQRALSSTEPNESVEATRAVTGVNGKTYSPRQAISAAAREARDQEERELRGALEAHGFDPDYVPTPEVRREWDDRDFALGQLGIAAENIDMLASRFTAQEVADRFGSDRSLPADIPLILAARDWLVDFTKAMGC